MSKGNIIVRLIDIVLILLFGFLVISEINRKSPIKLPQSIVPIKKEIDKEELFIVGITKEKKYLIEGEDLVVSDLNSLTNLIMNRKNRYEQLGKKMRVRIRSYWNMPIKYTMRIAKFCRKENIPAGMDIHSVGGG